MTTVDGIQVYTVKPTQSDKREAVLLIHEWWGLVDHVKRWADGFAARGYHAVAIDLFDGKTTTDGGEAARLMESANPKECLRKLGTVLDWMKRKDGLGVARIATVGWCFGGGLSLQCALKFADRVSASVIYYGLLETDPERLRGCKVPLLGIFGTRDSWITLSSVRKFEEACRKAGVALESHVFEAEHAFATPINPQYDPKLTKEAEAKVTAFLGRTLR